jgi:hypothetical protein
MNSELMKKLESLLNEFQERALSLREEYASITSIDNDLTKEDISRIKEIKEDLSYLSTKITDLTSDIDKYKNYDKEVNKLSSLINSSSDEGVKYLINKDLQEAIIKEEEFASYLEKKYGSVQTNDKNEPNNEEQEKEKKKGFNIKKPSKKTTISVIAILAALGLTVGVLKGCTNKNNSLDNQTEITDTLDNETNNEVKEILEFGDINDEEQVSKRADKIMNEINTLAPNNDYTIDEIENILKWINGGVVSEVSQEDGLFAITRVENLMNKENQEEVSKPFDISNFFLDGTQGKELASKIYNSKTSLMSTKGSENFKTSAEEFTKLMVNSWVLNGTNNEISSYVLETSGMKALIDTYFLNTYAYIDIPVEVSVMDATFDLDKIADAVNEANCKTTVTADNGETFDTYMNKFSSDMIGMITEATLNKQNSNSLTLKLN